MSLFKQLFIGICLFLVVAFTGSFVTGLESSRDQSVEQLQSHAQDAATALAMTLTPNIDDPAMVDVLVSSIFDSGYYDSIRVVDLQNAGQVMTERQAESATPNVPGWFAKLVNIAPQPATAIVMRGWEQGARVEVVSHPRFAIARLWDSALGSLLWLVGCGVASAILGALLLRAQLRPLDYLVDQSQAIARRQFLNASGLPRTPELRRVVEAMNLMVEKLKALFEEQAERSEKLRDEAYQDGLTGLANRRYLDMALQQRLSSDEQYSEGCLLLVRLNDLAGLNRRLGGLATDRLLVATADTLRAAGDEVLRPGSLIARSRGGDFAILAPGLLLDEAERLAATLSQRLQALHVLEDDEAPPFACVGLASYRMGDAAKSLLVLADEALGQAEQLTGRYWASVGRPDVSISAADESRTWQTLLDGALADRRLLLHVQPVRTLGLSAGGEVLHDKVLARLLDANGEVIPAGRFLPWIERFGWGAALDQAMLTLVLERMGRHEERIALSLSSASLKEPADWASIVQLLRRHPQQAARLTLEVDESHLPDQSVLERVARDLREFPGCGLAIQHFSGRFSLIANLSRLGLAYLKLDGSYVRDIDEDADKRTFVEALQRAANSIDLPVIAERVETEAELQAIRALGLAGATGRLLGEPQAWAE